VRGEHRPSSKAHSLGSGSSPRARGTRGKVHGRYSTEGIIPACAGNTL